MSKSGTSSNIPFGTLRHSVFVLIGSIACLIILMLFTFKQFRRYEQHTTLVEHSYKVISTLQNIKGYFTTEAYLRRGYVLFPHTRMERQARQARANLLAQLDTLRSLVKDNPDQTANTYRLISMVEDTTLSMNKWNLYLAIDSSARMRYMKHDIAPSIALHKHTAIYQQIEQMLRHEDVFFLACSEQQQTSARNTPLLFLLLTTAALIFLIYSFWQIQGAFRKKKEVQRALEETLSDLKIKNEELERLSLLTAHHLKEPLRKAQTFLSRLHTNAHFEAADQHALQRATTNLKHMQQQLHDLTQYYNITLHQKQHSEAVPLDKVLQHALRALRTEISQSGAAVEVVGSLPIVLGHHENLQFVFKELLYNALRYHREHVPPRIQVWASSGRPEQVWQVHIKDHGIGIEPAYQARIFQVFERLQAGRTDEGTGIGLAICRRIMLAYGGNISVESEAGVYSTFTLTFPMSAPKAAL